MSDHDGANWSTFSEHEVDLVFICELHENHHDRAVLPPGWQRIGAGEFLLAMAPGWRTIHIHGLQRVWPDVAPEHKTQGWRQYFQAGGSTGSSSRQQEAAAASSVSSKQRVVAGR